MVPTTSQAGASTLWAAMSLALPTNTSRPSTRAQTPWPDSSAALPTRAWSTWAPYARRTDAAMGWSLKDSACAASSSSSSSWTPSAGWTATTSKVPLVRVPVLSKTTVSTSERASR